MTKTITRLLPDGQPGKGMAPLGYIDPDTVSNGSAVELGYIFFTDPEGTVNAGVWECTPCTEAINDYPYDQCCMVLEGSLVITDETGHAERFLPGDAFMIPRGFNGSWTMTERYKNFFVTVEPKRDNHV
jgi:uncharacterized cupin superfamily protein